VPCPANSETSLARGAVDASECVCKPGYFHTANPAASNTHTHAHLICEECSAPHYCAGSHIHTCPQNMSTVANRAKSNASCQCWTGFFELHTSTGQNMGCREVPVAYFEDFDSKQPTKCPPPQTTLHTKSTSPAQCVSAGGYKADPIQDTAKCVPCVSDEVCAIASRGPVVGRCDQYKQVVNVKHDACVCEAGFLDNKLMQQGAMRCIPCPAGFYCPQQRESTVRQAIFKCLFKRTSHPGTPSQTGCFCEQSDKILIASTAPLFELRCLCASSHYDSVDNNACKPCPQHIFESIQSLLSATSAQASGCVCVSGFYATLLVLDDDTSVTQCILCPAGHFCTAGQRNTAPTACPLGTFGPSVGQASNSGCLACPSVMPTTQGGAGGRSTIAASAVAINNAAHTLQGTVVDCFLTYTPMYTSRVKNAPQWRGQS